RRHTRCYRDWSSDVCSSDLLSGTPRIPRRFFGAYLERRFRLPPSFHARERQAEQQIQLRRLITRSLCKPGGFIPACTIECLPGGRQARFLRTVVLGETWNGRNNQAE